MRWANFFISFMQISIVSCAVQDIVFGTLGNPNFYASCVQSAFQGWNNLGAVFPLTRWAEELEHALDPPESEIPTEVGSLSSNLDEVTPKAVNATTKLVLDRDANGGVFQYPLEYLTIPQSVLRERIRYLLFTNVSKNEYQVMSENGDISGTNWNPNRITKVLIHGLTSDYFYSAIKNIWLQHIFEIKDAYLNPDNLMRNEYNILVVDWTSLSTVPLIRYPDAAVATIVAAEDVANFLLKLKLAGNIRTMDDLHLLGHSLGAHVAGIVGHKLQEIERDYLIRRITGLDPAGPCYNKMSGSLDDMVRILDKRDAKFVDIIHTNMGNVIRTVAGRYGNVLQTGHVDFYPNGGEVQLGCNFLENRMSFCSHQKSVAFYALSIMKRFMACPCPNWESYGSEECACTMTNKGIYFGEHVNPSARGKYFLPL